MKSKIQDLALLGGPRLFDKPLHVGKPNLPNKDEFISQIDQIWESQWLTNNGPKVQEFEASLSKLLNVKHCIAICNATRALEIAIRALGMEGEVITPSFTFVATAHSLQWQGITPVFCDIDPETHNINPDKIEALITPRTTGIIPVHLWGRPCAIHAIEKKAAEHNLKVLYDASHAFGCTYEGRPIASFGDAEVFSFHATKVLTTFEGGCITTNNDELAETIRLMKNFGFSGKDNVIHIGTNGKMSEVSAVMGSISLQELDNTIESNRHNYSLYADRINKIPNLKISQFNHEEKNNFHYIIIEIDEKSEICRDKLVELLEHENILARRYFYPGCHRMEPYRSLYPNARMLLPETEALSKRLFCLPNGPAIKSKMIDEICKLLKFIIENFTEIGQN